MTRQRVTLFAGLICLGVGALAIQWISASNANSTDLANLGHTRVRHPQEGAALCPWRSPEADMQAFFPGATRYDTQAPILSSLMAELKQRLGRLPTIDENPLYLHRVYANQQVIGTVLVRRVKGEYGAIEIVLAVAPDGTVRGLEVQRQREPEAIANALTAPRWLATFRGQTVGAKWQLGAAVPEVSAPARPSAQAVVEGVRSLLILLDAIQKNDVPIAYKQ